MTLSHEQAKKAAATFYGQFVFLCPHMLWRFFRAHFCWILFFSPSGFFAFVLCRCKRKCALKVGNNSCLDVWIRQRKQNSPCFYDENMHPFIQYVKLMNPSSFFPYQKKWFSPRPTAWEWPRRQARRTIATREWWAGLESRQRRWRNPIHLKHKPRK